MSGFDAGGSQLDTSWFLLLAAVLFILGTIGVLVRRNPLVILICIELMLNAANLTLVAFSRQLQNYEGQLFALMSMTVAAAEAVVGLAILVDIFRHRDAEDIDDLSELKGRRPHEIRTQPPRFHGHPFMSYAQVALLILLFPAAGAILLAGRGCRF